MCNWWSVLLLPTTPGEGEVRLVGGSGPHAGRVEVNHNGVWGTVCSWRNWDLQDAMVVCRQLGYGRAVSAPRRGAFGEGTGPVWYDNVRCNGREAKLTQCGHSDLERYTCGYRDDAGAICASE